MERAIMAAVGRLAVPAATRSGPGSQAKNRRNEVRGGFTQKVIWGAEATHRHDGAGTPPAGRSGGGPRPAILCPGPQHQDGRCGTSCSGSQGRGQGSDDGTVTRNTSHEGRLPARRALRTRPALLRHAAYWKLHVPCHVPRTAFVDK